MSEISGKDSVQDEQIKGLKESIDKLEATTKEGFKQGTKERVKHSEDISDLKAVLMATRESYVKKDEMSEYVHKRLLAGMSLAAFLFALISYIIDKLT